MTSPVEAQSLSSLTNLFANPPQYPRNPTHEVREPLVLYIVRVPGSKDVFLTPLKPATKASISVEAIQSSLYYLHVVTSEDEILRRSLEGQTQEQEPACSPHSVPILRKPLPPAPFANYPPLQRPPIPPKSYPHYQPPASDQGEDTQVSKFHARGINLRLSTANVDRGTGVKRKPLGPRQLHSGTGSDHENGITRKPIGNINEEDIHSSKQVSAGLNYPPSEPARTVREPVSHKRTEDTPLAAAFDAPEFHAGDPTSKTQDSLNGVVAHEWRHPKDARTEENQIIEITIIRRDPFSKAQWNIGKISIDESPYAETSHFIELTTPGYGKFARQPEFPNLETMPQDADSIRKMLNQHISSSPVSVSSVESANAVFSRKVQIQASNQDRRLGRQQPAEESVGSIKQVFRPPNPKMRPKFAFVSPWHGQCSFTTGVDGRSLKCRHTLPQLSSGEEGMGLPVAELRFNLPWLKPRYRNATLGGTNSDNGTSHGFVTESKESFKKSLHHLRQRSLGDAKLRANSDRELHSDGDIRLDLKLGQEKAGGGFKGKSAKLGKIIIEDEGLKMCDLVVAACMGIWWQQYSAVSSDI